MVAINPERYTKMMKGYITYPNTPDICRVLLEEVTKGSKTVEINGKFIHQDKIDLRLIDAIKSIGGKVHKATNVITIGRKNVFGIDVEVRKLTNKNKLESIRIRITGNTVKELLKNMDTIKEGMAKWGVEPKECLWTRSGDISMEDTPIVKEDDVKKEISMLKAKIDAQQQDITELKEKPIKKAMKEDRHVFNGVIN